MPRPISALMLALLLATPVGAEPIKLRIGTVAPEGTSWAREMHNFAREVETSTDGHVQIKWYLGGVTGDELTALGRVRKGQLDGAGVTIGCESLAPSLRVSRMAGLIRSHAEARYVFNMLHSRAEQEFAQHGFFDFGVGPFGEIIVFSRRPIRSFAELTRTRMWVWDKDQLWIDLLRRMGLTLVPTPVEEAAHAYEEGRVDGFFAPPGVALVWQWTTLARYFTDLRLGILPVCFVMTQRAVDAIPLEERAALTSAAAKLADRFQDVTRDFDESLIGGLLAKQGLTRVPATEALASEFYEAARRVRETFDPHAITPAQFNEVLGWLADYRAEHANHK